MTRDLTQKQFVRAANRNGFTVHLGCWLHDEDTGISYGGIMLWNGKEYRLNRRMSLAKALRERDENLIRPGLTVSKTREE